jgi:hypothetical protein
MQTMALGDSPEDVAHEEVVDRQAVEILEDEGEGANERYIEGLGK